MILLKVINGNSPSSASTERVLNSGQELDLNFPVSHLLRGSCLYRKCLSILIHLYRYLLGITCLQCSISGNPGWVTWITQNFKQGRESNRSMSWRDSWIFSSRIEICRESSLTCLSEAFNQFCHLIHIRMHIQLSLPQHYSSTDVKAQVLSRCYLFLSHGIWSYHAGTTDLKGRPGHLQDAI